MIAQVIKLLQLDDWLNVSQTVEIAKGKNEIAKDIKTAKKQIRRVWLSRK